MHKKPGILVAAALFALTPTLPTAQEAAPSKGAATKVAAKDNPLQLNNDAPTIYTVVKGDTLWDISGKFLKEPWRWPEIWNMNRDQIKNPHLIYPGDVVKLSFDASGRPMLTLMSASGSSDSARLSPRIREERIGQAIPSIPARVIAPFLSAPLVAEADALNKAPRIVASEDNRVIVGAGNVVYAVGMQADQGVRWNVYRPGKGITDPVTGEVLGFEAEYLGDARVTRFGQGQTTPSTLEILRSTKEINRGDRLMPASDVSLPQYSPRAPEQKVSGAVAAVVGGVTETAQYSIIVLNLGRRSGIEAGNVLALQTGGSVVATNTGEETSKGWSPKSLLPAAWREKEGIPTEVQLPLERNGLAVVFRVFDRVSYALVMSSKRPIKVGDIVQSP
ncbi:MAG: LysM peptidoglycan-binding domain-containing protein [Burkholderiales bacterium]